MVRCLAIESRRGNHAILCSSSALFFFIGLCLNRSSAIILFNLFIKIIEFISEEPGLLMVKAGLNHMSPVVDCSALFWNQSRSLLMFIFLNISLLSMVWESSSVEFCKLSNLGPELGICSTKNI